MSKTKTRDASGISSATVPYLMEVEQAEKVLVLCEIGMQLSRREHANHASGDLQFGLCLKSICQILADNQVSHF